LAVGGVQWQSPFAVWVARVRADRATLLRRVVRPVAEVDKVLGPSEVGVGVVEVCAK
jgi:hypothetical protein